MSFFKDDFSKFHSAVQRTGNYMADISSIDNDKWREEKLGLSERHVDVLASKLRSTDMLLSDIVAQQSQRGKGKFRIDREQDGIIHARPAGTIEQKVTV